MTPKSKSKSAINNKNLPPIPPDWQWVRLCEVAEVKLGKMLSRKAYEDGLVQLPYLRNKNVRWFSIDDTDLKIMGFKEKEIDQSIQVLT